MEENQIIDETTAETKEVATVGDNSTFKPSTTLTMWNDAKMMSNAWKMAGMLAKTSIVPDAYKENAGNCLIAIDIANRMGLSPLMVMQNSQIVKGSFTWKGSACKGLIDASNRFVKSKYIFVGEEGKDNWGCYLQAEDKDTGEVVKGATVTIRMAKDEGWMSKNGSKWQTFPELMLQYRAATFFARAHCPQSLMGFYTNDEMFDIGKGEPEEKPEVIKISLKADEDNE